MNPEYNHAPEDTPEQDSLELYESLISGGGPELEAESEPEETDNFTQAQLDALPEGVNLRILEDGTRVIEFPPDD